MLWIYGNPLDFKIVCVFFCVWITQFHSWRLDRMQISLMQKISSAWHHNFSISTREVYAIVHVLHLYIKYTKQFICMHALFLQEKLPVEQIISRNVPDNEPVKPPALDNTPFTFVEDLKTLEVLATKLKDATEFAVSVLLSC